MKEEIKKLQEKAREEFDNMDGLKYELLDAVFLSSFCFHRPLEEVGAGNVLEELEAKDIADRAYPRIRELLIRYQDTLIEQTYKQGREDLVKEIEETNIIEPEISGKSKLTNEMKAGYSVGAVAYQKKIKEEILKKIKQ